MKHHPRRLYELRQQGEDPILTTLADLKRDNQTPSGPCELVEALCDAAAEHGHATGPVGHGVTWTLRRTRYL